MKKLFPLLLSIIILGCTSDDHENIALTGYENVYNYSANGAKMVYTIVGLDTLNSDLEYRFDVYEIRYKTKYGNRTVEASAMVSIPDGTVSFPILSFQHGTIVANDEAPSADIQSHLPIFSLASAGYIVVVPDFIGFGSTSEIFHPYYVAEPMGRSVADAILATKELMSSVEGDFNGDVFLAGYSEGGYATMAAHKYMEEHPRSDLRLIASAPASGGYDVKGMQEYFFSLENYNQPFYIAYVAMAYKEYYGMSEPLDLYFQEPYASKMENLFDGEYSGSQINSQLTNVIEEFLQPAMFHNFETSEAYRPLRELFIENSLTNWDPVAPVFMYHGTADVTVPYHNSTSSYEQLINEEADLERIKFIPLQGADHGTGVIPYVKDVYYKFKALK